MAFGNNPTDGSSYIGTSDADALKLTRSLGIPYLSDGALAAVRSGSLKGLTAAAIVAAVHQADDVVNEDALKFKDPSYAQELKDLGLDDMNKLVQHYNHEREVTAKIVEQKQEQQAANDAVFLATTSMNEDTFEDWGDWDDRIVAEEYVPTTPDEIAAEEKRMEGIASTIAGPISPDDIDAIAESQGMNKEKFAEVVAKKAAEQAAANPKGEYNIVIKDPDKVPPAYIAYGLANAQELKEYKQGLDAPDPSNDPEFKRTLQPAPTVAPNAPQPGPGGMAA